LIARIELTLSNGKALIVAEGSVAKHLATSPSRPGGLVVRFRRMSAASSDFIKRAVAKGAERPLVSSPLVSSPISSVLAQPPPRRDTMPPTSGSATPPESTPTAAESLERLTPSSADQRARGNPARRTSAPPSAGPRSVATKSTSVPPPSQRLSSRPTPQASVRPGEHREPQELAEVESAAKERSTQGTSRERIDQDSERHTPQSQHSHHDVDAIARLRQRHGIKPISVPPDREAVLARLKKP
jgi:hypothetical protein